jgi:uncharacterized metal-binding protein YceD (DUF177 family)
MTQPPLWHVTVRLEDVPETGLHLELAADAQVRAALAVLAGVREMPRLEAVVDVVRQGSGLRATGRVSATVGQNCVVTLDPLENNVEEPIDVVFAPPAAAAATHGAPDDADDDARARAGAQPGGYDGDEPPEALIDGTADLGAILSDFLLLGIDRYPRKPGAVFAPPAESAAGDNPFSVLAKLKNPGS